MTNGSATIDLPAVDDKSDERLLIHQVPVSGQTGIMGRAYRHHNLDVTGLPGMRSLNRITNVSDHLLTNL
ncbi:MAG TPA: hypothetical protein ENK84_09725 [Desulfobulbus sp.]|nr:hypothetical protein [Desulfobulbus sp.]